MTKERKRRVKKARPHQVTKSSTSVKNINWTRIALIVLGVAIAASMILSLVVTPGV